MIDIILLLFLGSQVDIIRPLDFLLRFLMDDVHLTQEYRETMFALGDMQKRQLISILIDSRHSPTFFILVEVQAEDTVVRGKDRNLITLFLTEQRQHQGIHAMVGFAIERLRPCCLSLRKPRLLPLTLLRFLQFLNEHLRKERKGFVLTLLCTLISTRMWGFALFPSSHKLTF